MSTSYVKEHKNNWRLNKSICIKKKKQQAVSQLFGPYGPYTC